MCLSFQIVVNCELGLVQVDQNVLVLIPGHNNNNSIIMKPTHLPKLDVSLPQCHHNTITMT